MTAAPGWLREELVTLAWCWRLARRDGVVVGLTSHDRDLMVGGILYRAAPGMHGKVRAAVAGGVTIDWARRSRVDTGWRDHVDQPLGEASEAWRIALVPPVPGIGPWASLSPTLNIGAPDLAMLPPGCTIEVRQVGDFALSPPLSLPLT